MNLSFSNGRRATDSFSLHHPYDDLSLPTRGLILDIDPEKEGRLEERRENADTLTRYPTYPFAFSTCVQKPRSGGEGGGKKKETEKGTASFGAPLPKTSRLRKKFKHNLGQNSETSNFNEFHRRVVQNP